jgi:hypothetical protein
MNIDLPKLPEHWTLSIKEISMNAYRVSAEASDGRCVETLTGEVDLERVLQEIAESVRNSDRQMAEKLMAGERDMSGVEASR